MLFKGEMSKGNHKKAVKSIELLQGLSEQPSWKSKFCVQNFFGWGIGGKFVCHEEGVVDSMKHFCPLNPVPAPILAAIFATL